MAQYGDKLFLCIFFITCTVTVTQIPSDCCLSVKDQRIHKGLVVDYRRQISGSGCAIDAMILVTIRGKALCVPTNKPWVQKVMRHVDQLKIECDKKSYKGRRCTLVKREQTGISKNP